MLLRNDDSTHLYSRDDVTELLHLRRVLPHHVLALLRELLVLSIGGHRMHYRRCGIFRLSIFCVGWIWVACFVSTRIISQSNRGDLATQEDDQL